jgi:energy-converting hydrogenase Eha subunit A
MRLAGVVAAVATTLLLVVPAATARPDRQSRAISALTPAPPVEIMVVGAGNVILTGPRGISSASVDVRIGGHVCGISAATPLAALTILHSVGGPGFALRDYGHCTALPRNSGQLFVYSLDGETNHGQNGWEYKVNNRSGTTGAADPSGPQGNGRLLTDGSRVLWFWCQAVAGGCQRTLEVSAPKTASRGSSVSLRVTGYDNEGRGVPMPGARVTLGSSSAVTGASGQVTLRAPSGSGFFGIRAMRPGSVPSFPQLLQVR